MPDGSFLQCEQQGSSFMLLIRGKLDTIADTMEQLGWLASALRPSPISDGIVACIPSLTAVQVVNSSGIGDDAIYSASCEMVFSFTIPYPSETPVEGFCWSNLFRNPVLVAGYPILHRIIPDTGLDIRLEFISQLIESGQIFQLDEMVILKGFCSLLVASKVANEAIIWHLLSNKTGDRISFCDSRLDGQDFARDLSRRDLESRRYVVGWCSAVKEYSGNVLRITPRCPSYED